MRERKTFAERTRVRSTNEVNRKYFLVYEGSETEELYFRGVDEERQKIGIDPLIELIPIVRSYSEEGWSNPQKILDRMMQTLRESETGNVSYETLMNWIMDYLHEEGILTTSKVMARSMWRILQWICAEEMQASQNDIINDKDLGKTCEAFILHFEKSTKFDNIVSDVPKIIQNRAIIYAEDVDKICFIFDRDRESFVAHPENNQYQYVLNTCREKGFGFYLTNPCFEFWLLMHFNDISNLDEKLLLKNPKVASKRRYTEQQLKERMQRYHKSSYDVAWFVERIDTAIENEKKYCENEDALEYSLGSRVGILIQEMRGTSGKA